MSTPQEIVDAVQAYYAAVSRGDIETVAGMFAPDAVTRDPVGTPPATDPAARRNKYAAIAAIFDGFAISAKRVIPCGDEAAAEWTARATTKAGREVSFEGISMFVMDPEQKIASMSVYFDAAALGRALQA